jgi:serine phosphatase RsbU (regulator of sigma subunit)
MNLNKLGKYFLTVSGLIFLSLVVILMFADGLYEGMPEFLVASLFIIFIMLFCLGLTFVFYNSEIRKRKRMVLITTVISTVIFLFGIYSKRMHWAGAAVEVILSIFLFSFTALPLIIKSRYERLKSMLSNRAIVLSLADLFSIIFLFMGFLFRFVHWPGGTYLTITGAVALVITLISWNRSYKKEVNLRLQTEEKLRETLKEVEEKHLQIEEKNKEITDSINYAKRIQEAILPPVDLIRQHFPQSFVYYQPKAIVAGDFYWAEHINDVVFIAAADCTGHGVPGALVSVVCSNALNRSVKEFKLVEPGHILDKTKELVLDTFSKSGEAIKDGMDISLLSIKKSAHSLELKWAGANNPLWYVKNKQLTEIRANKQPIGKSYTSEFYVTHSLSLAQGDTLYLFSDGYADQFGGPKGKKFKYKQFADLLVSTQELALNEQFSKLSATLNDWKGDLEQVDDICIIGIRL